MTRGLGQLLDDGSLREVITSIVLAFFDASSAPEIIILPNTPFSSEDERWVEIRLIFESGPEELAATKVAKLRRRLFEIFERNGDDRRPLLRLISRADYQDDAPEPE